ncbi:hypothetical protein [Candidatus Pyrohabitans sp.]
MKIADHLEKIRRFENTLRKLDDEEDHETIVELCVLMASHYVNAALHATERVRQDRDIKHNRLEGFVRREECFGSESARVANLIGSLERLRPGQAYGRGRDGEVARRARELCTEIKRICGGVIGD